jgi:hypothetical protein
LGLEVDQSTRVLANQGAVRLNDSKWHHIAVTFPGRGSVVDEARFYVDGQTFAPLPHVYQNILTEAQGDNLIVGGKAADSLFEGWTGVIDDFAIWASALSQPMVRAIGRCAANLGYNASDMEKLFRLYRDKRGSALVKRRLWQYRPGLVSVSGTCAQIGGSSRHVLVLDAQGNGVVSGALRQ